jgi:hypothetical protein
MSTQSIQSAVGSELVSTGTEKEDEISLQPKEHENIVETRKNDTKDLEKQDVDSQKLKESAMRMNTDELKSQLVDLLPRMTGSTEEFRQVEAYINALEEKYTPPQTISFLNMIMAGEWQFLFTTDQLSIRPSFQTLRLTDLVQSIETNQFDGILQSQATWDLAENGDSLFNCRGSFTVKNTYKINQGARMTIHTDHDLKIELSKGSQVPSDVPGLVGLIHRAMPTEMFDPSDLAIDTTYLDTDIRIIRFTGLRHEGVRNIFMRKGAMKVDAVDT